jgi:hypothetical protein
MPSQSKGFFGDFFGKISDIWHWITDTADAVINEITLILTIKSVISDDFQSIINDMKELTAESEDFANRVKHLKTKVIRADVIFEFIDEIRTGELKRFCVDELQALQSGFSSAVSDALAAGQGAGIIKTGTLGTTNPVVKFIKATTQIFVMIAKFVHGLDALRTFVKDIKDKLESFEKVVLQQNNLRHSVDGRHRTRIP